MRIKFLNHVLHVLLRIKSLDYIIPFNQSHKTLRDNNVAISFRVPNQVKR